MNKKIVLGALSILAITTSLIFINIASAERYLTQNTGSQFLSGVAPLLVEDFTYPVGSLLTNNGWTAHSGAGTNPITVTSPGLTLTGYPSSGIGNAVSLTTSGEDVNRTFPVQSAGSVYAAFMVNVSDAAVDAVGGYFFHLGPDPIGTTFRGRVYIKKDASNNIAFGISKASNTEVTFTPFSYSLNTTYLVVVKYTIVDGAGNDPVSLFISTTTPASEPAPNVTAPDTTASDISPGTVALRQGATATSPTVRVDGIRVGTSWADVTGGGGATPTPSPRDANVDFDGDGKSDYVVTRPEGGDAPISWFINNNSVNKANSLTTVSFGLSTDIVVPEDYDGDGKDDIAVWRAGEQGFFYILQSNGMTFRAEPFGQTGDDPRVVTDYDGDGKSDVAVYRKFASGANYFYFRASSNNPNREITFVPWGGGQDLRPNVGDYDGDGKGDFCVYDDDGMFYLLRSSDLGAEFIKWGNGNEALVPGDFDADGRSDFCVVRNENNVHVWYILERDGGGTGAGGIRWGFATDVLTPGDYDGDGRQDIAVWRSNADPMMNFFFVRRSSDSLLTTFNWGRQNDRPAASWYVH